MQTYTPTLRLQSWDYRWSGVYFITICTKNRKHYLGQIDNHVMYLSHLGVLANVLWYEIKNRHKNITLGEFIIMPNHIHGIIINQQISKKLDSNRESSSTSNNLKMSALSPKPNSISTIIRSYKSAVSKHAHRLGYEFEWQPRFYEHIIRNEKSWHEINEYIVNNPKKWGNDKFYV